MKRLRKVFSKNLKLIRNKRNLSQERLAEMMGVSTRYLQYIESKNGQNISLDTIEILAKVLKVKATEFLAE